MLGVLTKEQSECVLRSEVLGRIGCYVNGKIYMVPITYAFDGKYIYAHSKEGLKIQMMRSNPNVCFQVDHVESMTYWRSVLVWGKYEELKTKSSQAIGMKILRDRLMPLLVSESVKPIGSFDDPKTVVKELKPVVYRISINEITGRFEKADSINFGEI